MCNSLDLTVAIYSPRQQSNLTFTPYSPFSHSSHWIINGLSPSPLLPPKDSALHSKTKCGPLRNSVKQQAELSQALQVSHGGHCPVKDLARQGAGESQKPFRIYMFSLLQTGLPQKFPCYRWHCNIHFINRDARILSYLQRCLSAVPVNSTWALLFPHLPELLQQGIAWWRRGQEIYKRGEGEEPGCFVLQRPRQDWRTTTF